MSKIGDLMIQLDEQAGELGFESVDEAIKNGYEIMDYQLVQSVEVAFEERKKHNEEVLNRAIRSINDEQLKQELEELKGEL